MKLSRILLFCLLLVAKPIVAQWDTVEVVSTPASCSYTADGSVKISVDRSGFTYTYELYDGNTVTLLSNVQTTDTTFTFTGLKSDNYFCLVETNIFDDKIIDRFVGAPDTILVTFDPLSPNTICEDADFTYNNVVNGGSGTYTNFLWTGDTGPLSSTSVQNPDFDASTDGTFNLSIRVTDNLGCIGVSESEITVNPSPNETLSVSNDAICAGETADITVIAGETGVNYFLRLDSDDSVIDGPTLGDGSNITFNDTPVATTVYHIFAENPTTTCAVELTDKSTVTVTAVPDNNRVVQDDVICLGENGEIVVESSQAGVSYQARLDADDSNTGAPAVGTGADISLNIPDTDLSAGTVDINIVASENGCSIELLDLSEITVNDIPTITLGANPEVCVGITTANLSYTSTTNAPDQYSIDFDVTAQGAGFVDVVNAALPASPIPIAVPFAVASGTYDAVLTVSNSGTSCGSIDYNIQITVNENPTIALGVDPEVCQGITTASLPYSATTGSPSEYSINFDATAEGEGFVDVAFTNLDPSPISVVVPLLASVSTYNADLTVRNTTTGCTSTTNAFDVIVGPIPDITLGTNPEVCEGETSAILTYTGTAGSPDEYNIDFDVTAEGEGFADVSGVALGVSPIVITVPGAAAAGTYDAVLTVTNTTTGCSSFAKNIQVVVNENPSITLDGNPEVCQGETSADLIYTGTSGSPDEYLLDFDATAEAQGFVDIAYTNLGASPITITVPGGASVGTYNVNIQVRNTTTGCEGATQGFTITVNTVPTITLGADPSVCFGEVAASLPFTGTTGSPDEYSIDFNPVAEAEGFADVGFTNLGASPISLVVPAAGTPATYDGTITVQNSVTGCGSSSSAFQVTINPLSTITLGANPEVCMGETSANLTYTGTAGSPDEYSIDFDVTAEGEGFGDVSGVSLGASPIVITVPGTAAGAYNAVLTVTNTTTGCASGTQNIQVVVNENPSITLDGNPEVCQGETTANLIYTGTSGSPDEYLLDFDATAEAQGFVDVAYTNLGASPITITVPATASVGTYNVDIQVRNTTTGCEGSAQGFTVTVNTVPTITLGADPSVCFGETTANLVYTGTSGSPDEYSINFNPAAEAEGFADVAFTNLGASPVTLVIPAAGTPATYDGTITVQNAVTGCGSSSSAFQATIDPLPTITLGTNPEVCIGETSADLTFTGTTGSPDEYSIDFDVTAEAEGFVDVSGVSLGASPIVISVPGGASAGTYDAVLTVTNTITGCSSSIQNIQLVVNAIPTITLGDVPQVCQGETLVDWEYTATLASPDMYSIDFDITAEAEGFVDISDAALVASPISMNVPGGADVLNYMGVITVENSTTGCVSAGDLFEVFVNSAPSITLNSDADGCIGDTLGRITYTATTGNPDEFSVDFDVAAEAAGFIDAGFNAFGASPIEVEIPSTAPLGAYDGTITVRNGVAECGSVSESFTIEIHPLPTPALLGETEVCLFDPLVYYTDPGQSNYEWILPGVLGVDYFIDLSVGINRDSLRLIWVTPGVKTLGVNFDNANGCSAENPTEVAITVNGLPSMPIAGDSIACEGTTTVLNTNPTLTSYEWEIIGNAANYTIQNGTSDDSLVVTWDVADSMYVTVTAEDANGCSPFFQDTLLVFIPESNNIIVTNPSRQEVCETDTAAFIVEVNGYPPYNYTWFVKRPSDVGFVEVTTAFAGDPNFTGANSDTLRIINIQSNYVGEYRCEVTDNCASVQTSTADSLVLKASPDISLSKDLNDAYCVLEAADTLVANSANVSFAAVGLTNVTDLGGGQAEFIPGLNTGEFVVQYADTAVNGCYAISFDTTIVVPAVDITRPIEYNAISCSDADIRIKVLNPQENKSYTLRYNSNNQIVGNTVFSSSDSVVINMTFDDSTTTFNILAQDTLAGCADQLDSLITITALPSINLITASDTVSCFGDSDSKVFVTASGGFGNFTYAWFTDNALTDQIVGETTDTLSNQTEGIYYIRVTDDNACSKIDSVEVVNPDPITIFNLVTESPSCEGGNDGEITFEYTGGKGSIQGYLNAPPLLVITSPMNYAALSAADHELHLEDENGCELDTIITLEDAVNRSISLVTSRNLSCVGIDDGTITVVTENGGDNTVITLSSEGANVEVVNDEDSVTFLNLSVGEYIVFVTDDCSNLATDTIEIIEATPVEITSASAVDKVCFGDQVDSIKVTVEGGNLPFYFILTETDVPTVIDTFLVNERNPGVLINLGIGDYRVMVEDTTSACYNGDTTDVLNISQPLALETQFNEVSQIECLGDSTAAIDVTTINGAGSITYTLLDTLMDFVAGPSASGRFEDLGPGTYLILGQDDNGCFDLDTIEFVDPDPILVSFSATTDETTWCADNGSMRILATGTHDEFDYIIANIDTILNATDTVTIGNISQGIYTVEIYDSLGCRIDTGSIELGGPTPITVTYSDTVVKTNVQLTINSTGGFGLHQYSLILGNDTIGPQTSNEFENLENLATYIVRIEDTNCVFIDTFQVTGYPAMDIDVTSITGVGCYEDSISNIDITVTNSFGRNYFAIFRETLQDTVTFLDTVAGNILYRSGVELASLLPSGQYIIQVHDSLGRFASDTLVVGVDSIYIDDILVTEPNCGVTPDGELTAIAMGGSINSRDQYDFIWYRLGIDSVVVSTDSIAANITAGNYTIVVADSNNCSFSQDITLTTTIQSDIQYSFNEKQVTCALPIDKSSDGRLTVVMDGNHDPSVSFWLSLSGDTLATDVNTIDSIMPGTYIAVIEDTRNCMERDTTTIGFRSNVSVTVDEDILVCPGSEPYQLSNVVGTGGLTYQWQPSTNLSDDGVQNPLVTIADEMDYIVIYTDVFGCFARDTFRVNIRSVRDIEILQGDTIELQTDEFTVDLEAEDEYVSYNWIPKLEIENDTLNVATVTPTESRYYVIQAADSNGCYAFDSVFVKLPGELEPVTGFSPNGDGVNDEWEIKESRFYDIIEVAIFNRWGQQVFYSKGYSDDQRWNGTLFNEGKELPIGTYYYFVKYDNGDLLKGPITIVR